MERHECRPEDVRQHSDDVLSRSVRSLACVAAVFLILLMGMHTHRRAHVWTSEQVLWAEAVSVNPEKPRPWVNLGRQYALDGADRLAREAYEHARHLAHAGGRPKAERLYGEAYAGANLAIALMKAGDVEAARRVITHTRHVTMQDTGAIPEVVQRTYTWIAQQHASASF